MGRLLAYRARPCNISSVFKENRSMRIVHHLANSRSQRLLWLLEEMELPYEVKRYERDPKTMRAPPELRAVHPLGRSPLLDEDGTILAESAAIIEHLVR